MQIQVDGDASSVSNDANTDAEAQPAEVAADVAVVDEAEDVVTIGDSPPPANNEAEDEEIAKAPAWVKQVRAENKEKAKKIRDLEAKLQAAQAPAPVAAKPVLPKKPTLEDVDYDADKFEAELLSWNEIKRKHDAAEAEAQAEVEAAKKAAQDTFANYKKNAAALKVDDFGAAEHVVTQTLSIEQQNILLESTDNPHLVVYALGCSPEKAKELASIKSPAKFASALGKLEAQIKVGKRSSSAPPPERKPGTGGHVATVDQKLEQLEAEADRTGDRSKVIAYKRQLKSQQGK